jgi:hypothetical protein
MKGELHPARAYGGDGEPSLTGRLLAVTNDCFLGPQAGAIDWQLLAEAV